MYAPTRYLEWARRFYGQVPFDLASSGMTLVPITELGVPPMSEDYGVWQALHTKIAHYNDVPASDVMPALGTSHALWLAYASVLSPGDELLLEAPSYEPMWRIAEGMGVRVNRFERPIEARFAVDPARIAAAMTPRTRLVALSNLHNPSGARTSDEVIREVARIAHEGGASLLVDEVYAPFDGFIDGGSVWRGSARKLGANVITTSSLTKCYGLGNQRIGWMLAAPDVIKHAGDALTASTGHLPLPYACIAVHAFSRLEWLAARARESLRGKRETVEAWLAARPHITWSAPTTGLFGFAALPHAGDLTPRIEQGAREHGALVGAGAFFGVENGFRLSWSIDRAKLPEALAALGRVLDR